jgi:hypothetical protein
VTNSNPFSLKFIARAELFSFVAHEFSIVGADKDAVSEDIYIIDGATILLDILRFLHDIETIHFFTSGNTV